MGLTWRQPVHCCAKWKVSPHQPARITYKVQYRDAEPIRETKY
jgi:hypothetical protein